MPSSRRSAGRSFRAAIQPVSPASSSWSLRRGRTHPMTDDTELTGLDPVDILDREARRIEDHLAVLPEGEWSRQSRCALWSVRDVLAHLTDAEHYHRAC